MFENEDLLNWDDVIIYLCGPMDFAKDAGVGWRDEATKKLLDIGFKERNILNPCKKPKTSIGRNLSEEQRLANELRKKKDWKGLESLMKQIMTVDLRMVDKSDILIVNLSECERTFGTTHEIINARNQHKPTYIIDTKGKEHVSGWLMALVGEERVFESLDIAIEEIRLIKERGPWTKKDRKDYLIFDFDRRDNE